MILLNFILTTYLVLDHGCQIPNTVSTVQYSTRNDTTGRTKRSNALIPNLHFVLSHFHLPFYFRYLLFHSPLYPTRPVLFKHSNITWFHNNAPVLLTEVKGTVGENPWNGRKGQSPKTHGRWEEREKNWGTEELKVSIPVRTKHTMYLASS